MSDRTRTGTVALLILLAVFGAGRFIALGNDPPYDIVSDSGTFLTDEGWHTKAAALWTKYGAPDQQGDFVWLSLNPLFTIFTHAAFGLFGTGMLVARAASAVNSVVALTAFYFLCRSVQPRVIALTTCALVAVSLNNVAYARMALIEPTATTFGVLALLVWVRFGRASWGAGLALALGYCAVLCKISFLFTGVALAMLVAGEGVMRYREGERGRAVGQWIVLAVVSAVAYGAHKLALAWPGPDDLYYEWHVAGRAGGMRMLPLVKTELKMLFKLFIATGAPVLVGGIVFALLRQRWTGALHIRRPYARATIALTLWFLGGVAFFGMFATQPARYLHFALFPLAYLCVTAAREVVGDKHWSAAGAALLVLHGATQIGGYTAWLKRPDPASFRDMARDIATVMELTDDPAGTPLMGGTASNIALFEPRIRPLDFRPEDFLSERLTHWRPQYLVAGLSQLAKVRQYAPDVIESVEVVARYRVMQNYYTGEDHALIRLHYVE